MSLFKNDFQAGGFVIQCHEARLVTKVVNGMATYCKFSAKTGVPYGQTPANCMVKSLLVWADRLATPDEAARYDRELIMASCNQAAKEWVAGMVALMPSEFLSAELERRGILPGQTP